MKILRAVLLVVMVAPALVVVGATQAIACSCIPRQPDKVAVKDAAAVFTGTMVEADVAEPGFSPGTWTFAVDTVYKGGAVTETQDVTSQTQSAACGLTFKEEKRYAVFAYDDKGKLETNSCMNTRPLAEGKDLKLEPVATFDAMEDTDPRTTGAAADESGGWDPVAVAVVGLVVVGAIVGVALSVARRRKA